MKKLVMVGVVGMVVAMCGCGAGEVMGPAPEKTIRLEVSSVNIPASTLVSVSYSKGGESLSIDTTLPYFHDYTIQEGYSAVVQISGALYDFENETTYNLTAKIIKDGNAISTSTDTGTYLSVCCTEAVQY